MITEVSPRRRSVIGGLLGWMVSWSFVPVAIVAAAYFRDGRAIAEKTATELAMPVAAMCWISLVWGLKSLLRQEKRGALIGIFVSGFLFLTGSPRVASSLIKDLESRFPEVDIEKVEPFDYLVVLGGGTSKSPDGRAQFGEAGDRVGLAARLYHAKKVRKLVVTGDVLPGTKDEPDRDPSIQSKKLLLDLGVEEADVVEIEGFNTREEMAALKKRPEYWDGQRCGLITSGFHMPRAIRLAQEAGVNVVPLVADYRTSHEEPTVRDWLPSAAALRGNDLAFREYLAQLVGR